MHPPQLDRDPRQIAFWLFRCTSLSFEPLHVLRVVNPGERRRPATNLYYPGAGHAYFGLPPYYPFFTEPALGGTPQANALATEQFWTRMITFLNQLPTPEP